MARTSSPSPSKRRSSNNNNSSSSNNNNNDDDDNGGGATAEEQHEEASNAAALMRNETGEILPRVCDEGGGAAHHRHVQPYVSNVNANANANANVAVVVIVVVVLQDVNTKQLLKVAQLYLNQPRQLRTSSSEGLAQQEDERQQQQQPRSEQVLTFSEDPRAEAAHNARPDATAAMLPDDEEYQAPDERHRLLLEADYDSAQVDSTLNSHGWINGMDKC